MTITIRQADPERDYVRAAEILQTFERQPVTAEMLKDWDAQLAPAQRRQHRIRAAGHRTIQ